jgi:hypothetical protein
MTCVIGSQSIKAVADQNTAEGRRGRRPLHSTPETWTVPTPLLSSLVPPAGDNLRPLVAPAEPSKAGLLGKGGAAE